ncbi:hypothetical protein HZH68_004774 [Vespula germanica]|uniref:Uncharacterized protein n=1 Tax=Vespula germanica TaxID=30212 RepID=A0A834KPG4_VESGE|nr:hypothetical protein HZH68_004774 [Vespula germanica]
MEEEEEDNKCVSFDRGGFNENESHLKWDTNRGYLGGIQARNRRKLVGNAAPCMAIYSGLDELDGDGDGAGGGGDGGDGGGGGGVGDEGGGSTIKSFHYLN